MKAISTRYLAQTAFKPARVIATDSDQNRVVINWEDETSYRKAAEALCEKMGWSGAMAQGNLGPGEEVFVFVPVLDGLRRALQELGSQLVADHDKEYENLKVLGGPTGTRSEGAAIQGGLARQDIRNEVIAKIDRILLEAE